MSRFQIILLSTFGFFIVVAVLTFALYRGGSAGEATVVIWGDYPASEWSMFVNATGLAQDSTLELRYVEKSTDTIEAEFTDALAEGSGPDLIILSHDQFWKNRNKLTLIPYQNVSERNFKDTFVEAGEIFLTTEGIYALPLSIDPLILYYNRDLLSAAAVATPLAYWDEIYNAAASLTKRDAAGNITQSVIALGETRNIGNAKDILSLLFLQAGTSVTGFVGDSVAGELRSLLSNNFDQTVRPADAALDFFTQFSNPTKSFYSWNRSRPEAQAAFTTGDSAYYLGFASELRELRGKSPTLNFSVASAPQSRVSGKTLTFAKVKGVALSRGSRNPSAALEVALKLISRDSATALAQVLVLPPARRDLLSARPVDAVLPTFYTAALQSRTWLDPDTQMTKNIFYEMVDDTTSGRARTTEAVNSADRKLNSLIN